MKTAYTLLGLTLGIALNTQAQNVGINTDGSTPDGDAILHIKNDASSSKDSSVVRIENEQNGANDVTGVEIYNSGTGATAKWDVLIPASGSTDLRISNNGTDRVTIQNDGDVGIGTTSPASGLDVKTSMGYNINTFDASNPVPSTLGNTHNVVLCNDGPYTVNLPAANTCAGRVYYIKNIDTDGDDITIDGNASETINGSATYTLESYNHVVQIISDGTNWHIIEEANNFGGTISSLVCDSTVNKGSLTSGIEASYVASYVFYYGNNGGAHNGQTIASTGVENLTATLNPGTFDNDSSYLVYNITGTPNTSGTASFAINIGGQTCTLTRTVDAAFSCGDNVTFTYNGSSVTYGTVLSSTEECWLDRNLGATQVATSSTDANSYGDLFQWGRGDDGHQDRSSSTTSTNADSPGHGNFILEPNSPYDWRASQNDGLWQGVSGTNNPCPTGWRIPTEAEWEAERTTDFTSSTAAGAFGSVLKLPMAGRRISSSGSLNVVGTGGRYWSSTVSGTNARFLGFGGGSALMSAYYRADGFSVRCIKD